MTLIVDTGPLVALSDRRDRRLQAVRTIFENEPGSLIIPAPVTAEADYLLHERVGRQSARLFWKDIANGLIQVECLEQHEYETALEIDQRYQALNLGLADVSVIILARRFDTRRILTFDARHFRAVSPLQGGAFTLLPDDA